MPRYGRAQTRAHFVGKNPVPQTLGLSHFVSVPGPRHQQTTGFSFCNTAKRI